MRVPTIFQKYCDIDYRGYLLNIVIVNPHGVEIEELQDSQSLYHIGFCGKDILIFSETSTNPIELISNFLKRIDGVLGGRMDAEYESGSYLFCTVYYKDHKLEIEGKDTVSGESKYYYFGYSENPSFWIWKKTDYISIIEAFRKKVEDKLAGIIEEPADYGLSYKGHILTIRKKKDSNKYLGTSTLLDGKWRGEGWNIEDIVDRYKTSVDRVVMEKEKMLGKTYDTVCEEWGNTCYSYESYKNFNLTIKVRPQGKDRRALYIGRFSDFSLNYQYRKTFESIHYDKVVSRFQRFVDEYCTDWREVNSYFGRTYEYKGYTLHFKKEHQVENYFGTCKIHKNSIFKCINNSKVQIVDKFKARIDRMFEEKEKVQRKILTPKQEKIQELEQLQARISSQLEELKKEKDTLTYKGIVLEYGREEDLAEGWMIGSLKNAPEDAKNVYGKSVPQIKQEFEEYIDDLEKSANIYNQLMGK